MVNKMSKERELLEKVIKDADDGVMSLYLYKEVMDYLAQSEQPEQKLMTNRAIIQACPDHYCDMEKEAFKVGIKWYEKYVARIGVYSNE